MLDPKQAFHERFTQLQQKFIGDIALNVITMHDALKHLALNGQDETSLQKLLILAHQYNGSGQTFGYPDISHMGKMVEQTVRAYSATKTIDVLSTLKDQCQKFIALLEATTKQELPAMESIQAIKPVAVTSTPLQLLIADDDTTSMQLLSRKLMQHGHKVRLCGTGQEALESAKKYKPDLVLLDGMLPDLDGFSVLQSLKASNATKHIPVIMLTARRQEKSSKAAMALGAADYILKPYNMDELLARIGELALNASPTPQAATPPVAQEISRSGNAKPVYILGKEDGQGKNIADQLNHFGYQVRIAESIAAFKQLLEQTTPYAMIVFSDLSEDERALLAPLCKPKQGTNEAPHLIVSSRNDFDARLAAARLGARGYFTESMDVLKIIDKIEQLAVKYTASPAYHILIIDDDRTLIGAYSNALQHAGMQVTAVSDPEDALRALANQSIDLILIDFTMPNCNGEELAAIIRQHDRYVTMPIIFMSAQEDIEELLINTGLGIDDFLIKPVRSHQLVSVVRNRAQRAMELQALMARDSFTGLLNHANFIEMLGTELSQAKRNHSLTAYASIDIDHFKNVNDTYGHAAGDQVIRSLARMLQQRLRRADIIGRCGGEEFGIIMPGCPLANAQEVVESLRVKFSQSSYRVGVHDIQVTFSAGLTMIGPYSNLDELINGADKLLYSAKAAGRNRLVVG